MFSSAVSGRQPGELVLERRQGRLEHPFDGNLTVLDVQPRRLLRRVVLAHLGGIARRHRHRMHPLGAERIDGDAQGQRRIDAPGESQDDPRKAVLVDIVARTLHQGAVNTLLLTLQRNDLAAQRLNPAGTAREVHHIHPLGECRSAHGHLARRIHDEGISVKHQLILTADQVDEYQRNPRLLDARSHDLKLALRLLVHLVRGGIDDRAAPPHRPAAPQPRARGPKRPRTPESPR